MTFFDGAAEWISLLSCCDDLLAMYRQNFLGFLNVLESDPSMETKQKDIASKDSTTGTTDRRPSSTSTSSSWTTDMSIPDDEHLVIRRTSTLCDEKPLPLNIPNRDIHVDVEMAGGCPTDISHYDLIMKTKRIVQDQLRKVYSASRTRGRYILKVFVFMVSDGSLHDAVLPTEETTWGEAGVGLAWRIFKSDYGRETMNLHDGGVIVLTQKLDFGAMLNVFNNPGERCVVEKLAPMCSQLVIKEVRGECTPEY